MKVVAQEQKNYRKPSYRKQYLRGCQERVCVLEEIRVAQRRLTIVKLSGWSVQR